MSAEPSRVLHDEGRRLRDRNRKCHQRLSPMASVCQWLGVNCVPIGLAQNWHLFPLLRFYPHEVPSFGDQSPDKKHTFAFLLWKEPPL